MEYFPILRVKLKYLKYSQVSKIKHAYKVAAKAHEGQLRSTGEPYIVHPVSVACILADFKLDTETIIAALLHDVVEDTDLGISHIRRDFGKEVSELVDGVTKLTNIKFESKEEAQAEYFRKMMLAMVKDIRVIIVKLADRLHNMRTLGSLKNTKRRRIARETIEIYAPIARRLGIYSICIELEELCFSALYPMRHKILAHAVEKLRGNRNELLTEVRTSIQKQLKKSGIKVVDVTGREKNLYSIYKKMREKRLSFSEVFDLFAFRILVKNIDDCYRTLGSVHQLYKPVSERFKDYIATPKANLYQSLHTTLFALYGIPLEIQIRTEEMDKMAEKGVAAHLYYKVPKTADNLAQVKARQWVNNLLENQNVSGNSLEFIENVKVDLFPNEIYVFTPKGEIVELPESSTAVDFAYAIHSEVGNKCVGVKINGRTAPLGSKLTNGLTVEVITDEKSSPNPDWLNFTATGKASSNIRHDLKRKHKEDAIALGEQMFLTSLKQYNKSIEDIAQKELQTYLDEEKYKELNVLYEEIGMGNVLSFEVVQKILGSEQVANVRGNQKQHSEAAIFISGNEGDAITYADCCDPIPGDQVLGFIDKQRGLVVHTLQCPNIKNLKRKNSVPVSWEEKVKGTFSVEISTEVENKRGILASLTVDVAEGDSNIEDIKVADKQDGKYNTVNMTIAVTGRAHLARVMKRLRRRSSVNRIYRTK